MMVRVNPHTATTLGGRGRELNMIGGTGVRDPCANRMMSKSGISEIYGFKV